MAENRTDNPYTNVATERVDVASEAEVEERLAFIRRTYLHLTGAVAAFIAMLTVFFQTGLARPMTGLMLGGQFSWLITLGLFIGVSWLANRWAMRGGSKAMQYVGLVVYVVAQSAITTPLVFIAFRSAPGWVVPAAAGITLSIFSVLTGYVFVTKQDFNFLGPILAVASLVAFGIIGFGILFGFHLGLIFSFAMVGLACGYIVYDTSNVLHHYRTDQHVAASLALFASVVLLFWYVLQILLSFSD